uniref:Tetratricopeptide repeat domain 23 n=1 Tax=Poecilia latipinna TaxID=48699 RepID=A0A3B3UMK7_9TELE
MMPPEEKLKHFSCRAQLNEDNQKFDACIRDLVRCVALTQLVCGEKQLKLAQAHARLAKAYFQFKGNTFCISAAKECKKRISLFHSIVAFPLHRYGYIASVFVFHRVYARQNRPEEALSQCEKSLDLLKNCNKHERMCAVYKDMATIEQDRDHLDKAIDYLSKVSKLSLVSFKNFPNLCYITTLLIWWLAHTIAVSHSPEGLEGAQISHSLAMILSAAPDQHHKTARHYFERSLRAYRNSVGPLDPAFLAAQDDFCRYLLINGQQEKCVEIQRASLESKISTFGDLSSEVAETLQLIGSVEMTEGRVNQAHRTMTKCLDIHNMLYGPQHKKSKAVQKAVNMLSR